MARQVGHSDTRTLAKVAKSACATQIPDNNPAVNKGAVKINFTYLFLLSQWLKLPFFKKKDNLQGCYTG
jgi:hypothetical protein